MSSVPTIASGALRKMFVTLPPLGIDPDQVLAEVGIARAVVDDPDGRIPLSQLHAAWEAVLARGVREGAAVLGAQNYVPGDYGLVGFVSMNCKTLGEALAHVVRYVGLWTDDPGLVLGEDGTLRVLYRTPMADRPGLRCATEATLAEVLHGARLLTQIELAPREVRFAHPGPADKSVHDAFFRCPIRFGAADTAMVLTRETLALPLPKADEQLGAFLRTMANDALAKRTEQSSPLQRIRELIAEELQRGVPSLEQIARRMATSERTLRRRLEEDGTSFRNILDETRAELARSYVRDARMSLAEVAFMLGFSDPSAFHRAFKRWTDTTPSAWRAQAGAQRSN